MKSNLKKLIFLIAILIILVVAFLMYRDNYIRNLKIHSNYNQGYRIPSVLQWKNNYYKVSQNDLIKGELLEKN